MVQTLKQLMDLLDPKHSDQRSAQRRSTTGVRCSAGEVIDLSSTGMRVRASKAWAEGETRPITLNAHPHHLELIATCVWCRKEGWRRYVVGLRFETSTEQEQATLEALVQQHSTVTTHAPSHAA